jgi:hypothetical protein
LAWLLRQRVDGIHFADAVFDRDPAFAKEILEHVAAHQQSSTLLCYCSFNNLDSQSRFSANETE